MTPFPFLRSRFRRRHPNRTTASLERQKTKPFHNHSPSNRFHLPTSLSQSLQSKAHQTVHQTDSYHIFFIHSCVNFACVRQPTNQQRSRIKCRSYAKQRRFLTGPPCRRRRCLGRRLDDRRRRWCRRHHHHHRRRRRRRRRQSLVVEDICSTVLRVMCGTFILRFLEHMQ